MSGKEIALIAGLAVGGILMFRLQRWIQRWQNRAPIGVSFAVMLLIIGAAVLAQKELIPYEVAIPLILVAGIGELAWARIRYLRSPSLQRWERAWDEIAKVGKAHPAAADRILLETEEADRVELESLRAMAAADRTAARRFRDGVRLELRRLDELARRVRRALPSPSGETPLDLSLRRQREQREADLKWVEQILASSGAA